MTGESTHLTLNVHFVRGTVYWSVLRRVGHRNVMIARGTLTDPYPEQGDPVGSLLMEAAYAAYRLL